MNRPRFFVEHLDSSDSGLKTRLTGSDSRHALRALRLKPGDMVVIIDKSSSLSYLAALTGKSTPVEVEIVAPLTEVSKTCGGVKTVIFALCKGKKNDLVVEKVTELGVRSIFLFEAERSTVRVPDQKNLHGKLKRWITVAESASKQCGRRDIPQIRLFTSLNSLLSALPENLSREDMLIHCSLSERAADPRKLKLEGKNVHLLIGPEGDLSPEEEDQAERAGFIPVSLGPYTLRAETAAIAAAALMQVLCRKK